MLHRGWAACLRRVPRHAAERCAATSLLHDSVLDSVLNTPVIKLRHLAPKGVNVFVKCEAFNPMLSVKDRLSIGLIKWAETHGKLKLGQTVVDVCGGSSGIGLVMACRKHGYPLVIVTKDAPPEWLRLVRFLGARVLVCEKDPADVARRLAKRKGWVFNRDFQEDANAWIHENTTGPEIVQALGDRRLDYFVAPHGTGGMLRGVGKVLREQSPSTRICVVEQDSKPHKDYEKNYGPHPSWPSEFLRGFTTDFAPKPMNEDTRARFVDEFVAISGQDAMNAARGLAQDEFLFTGISGGALAAGALKVAESAPEGSNVLTVLLDTGHVRISTPLVDGVSDSMSEEEKAMLKDAKQPGNSWWSPDILGLDAH